MTVAYSVFLIFAILSVAYSWCRMKGSLFSKEVKLLIFKRHITYIIAYAILNSFCLLASIWSMMKWYGTEEMGEWVDRQCSSTYAQFFLWLFLAQGFLLPLVRMFEPAFFKIIYNNFLKLIKNEDEEIISRPSLRSASLEYGKDQLEPMSMIFNSALNAEFVYVILEGISQFSLLNYFKGGLTKDQYKRFKAMKYTVGDNGDTTVYLDKFLMTK